GTAQAWGGGTAQPGAVAPPLHTHTGGGTAQPGAVAPPLYTDGGRTAWLGRWHRPSHRTGAVAPPAWGGGTAPVRQSKTDV
ncbi:unnamed protein product, partial [Musa textilis]